MGNLTGLLTKILPAVTAETITKDKRNSENALFVENVSTINVKRTVKSILERSPILQDLVERKQIGIVGGMYDVSSGEVKFYHDTMNFGGKR
jgi:carbonic anhydrase